jgi:6-phosphogluconolactonase (cycloisomerase 2 family)
LGSLLTSAWVSSIKIVANETKSISVSENGSYIIKAVYMAPELEATDGVTYPSLAAFTGVIVTTGETVQVKIRTPTGL